MAQNGTHHDHEVQGTLPRLLVPEEAAELLRISLGQLYHLTSEHRIPFLKVGGQLRFEVEPLLEHLRRAGEAGGRKGGGRKNAARRGSDRVIRLDDGTGTDFRFRTPARRR